ncbi:MAG: hypothetical protein ALECFALPRED_008153 [Alectoria fallacina]|uniref:Uncharacterized protein n=1 Tax=Alectoria fallacina TaxID=1903189 RepID=A0A8H3J2G1_9LECA|nr:MAG: hypothetical protein ALECFALPRED_008153 [Alectoria fallacina]
MYILGKAATYATQVLFGLFVTSYGLPTTSQVSEQVTNLPANATLRFDNQTLIRSPDGIPWLPEISAFQASVPYPIPDTAITLNFTHFGFQIPVVRALSTIFDARQQVLSRLASNSEEATKNTIFEFSTRSTLPTSLVCSVVVQAYGGVGLSWLQLDHILEGLTQFSSGAGTDRQVHYQTLEFEVDLLDEGRIGTGLLCCTQGRGRGAAEVVKRRAETPSASQGLDKRLNLVSVLADETSPNLSNTSSLLSSDAAEINFPVPGANISLAFVWLGTPIPSKMVNEALNGAFLKIAPFMKESASEQVPQKRFFYWTTAGKVRIAIQIYGMSRMNWSQINSVIAGLFRFTNGIGTSHQQKHFENLGFDIKDEDGDNIGYGNLLAVPMHSSDIVRAVEEKTSNLTPRSINSTALHLYNANTSSHSVSTPPVSYIWPIPNTEFSLLFNYMGAPLPAGEVNAAINYARQRIRAAIHAIPDQPIGRNGFESHLGTVQVSVTAYEGAEISWRQLGEILTGLSAFCIGPYKRLLVFDVEVENLGPIAAGKLWYYDDPDALGIAKRATNPPLLQLGLVTPNTTTPSLSPTAPNSTLDIPIPVPYPVPHTSTTLLFDLLGRSIPPALITSLLATAMREIGPLASGPSRNERISAGQYQAVDASGRVAVTVAADPGKAVTWKGLENVLVGLREFSSNSRGRLRGEHFQVLVFRILEGRERVGAGNLGYYQ